MAGILPHSQHEGNHERLEWVASALHTDVYLETVEEAGDESEKPKEIRDTGKPSLYVGQYSPWLLENSRNSSSESFNNK